MVNRTPMDFAIRETLIAIPVDIVNELSKCDVQVPFEQRICSFPATRNSGKLVRQSDSLFTFSFENRPPHSTNVASTTSGEAWQQLTIDVPSGLAPNIHVVSEEEVEMAS